MPGSDRLSGTIPIDVAVESRISDSARARQLEGMFDVPRAAKSTMEWHGAIDLSDRDWNVGLIVGPSGSGKSTIARNVFAEHVQLKWGGASVVDDFAPDMSMETIASVCQAVGFNTIPAWLRPHDVLSTGEQFRVDLARRLVELPDPIVVDEFSSVVDRQVAQIGSHAVQKYVRRNGRQFIAVSCHYDIMDWLQPDWVLEPATMSFSWRSVQPRPQLDAMVARVPYSYWQLFAPFHYLTSDLHRAARCFVLFVNDRPAAFGGMLHRPHPRVRDIWGLSRLVTLPDWQGLGLAFVLTDRLAAAYKAAGRRFHTYPAHPALIHAFDRSPVWAMTKKPGQYNIAGKTSSLRNPAARAASNRAAPGFANSGWGKDAAARQAASPTNRDQIEAAQAAGVPFRGSLPVASGPNRPKRISNANNPTSRMAHRDAQPWIQGSRINAIFEYVGEAGSKEDAECLLS